jgi:hypothetical protein
MMSAYRMISVYLYYVCLLVLCLLYCISSYLYYVRLLVPWCLATFTKLCGVLPYCMMSAHYDVCIPLLLYSFQYDFCSTIWCLPTCMMYAQLCNVCSPVCCLFNYTMSACSTVISASCLMFAQLYNVYLSVWCLLYCTVWCLPTCTYEICLSVWCLPIYMIDSKLMSSYFEYRINPISAKLISESSIRYST